MKFFRVEKDKDDDECQKIADTTSTLRAIWCQVYPPDTSGFQILDDAFRLQVMHMHRLLNAASYVSPKDFELLQQSRTALFENKSGWFYKAITIFATGIHIRLSAEKILEAFKTDMPIEIDLNSAMSSIEKIDPLPPEDFVSNSAISVPHTATIVAINKKRASVYANGSEALRQRRKADLEAVDACFTELCHELKTAFANLFDASLHSAFPLFAKAVVKKQNAEAVLTELKEILGTIGAPYSPTVDLLVLLPKVHLADFQAFQASRDNMWAELQACAPWIYQLFNKPQSCDAADTTATAFFNCCGVLKQLRGDVKDAFTEFVTEVYGKQHARVW